MSSSDVQAQPGPSRQPTISSEADEAAAEAGFGLAAGQALSSTVPQAGVTSINGEAGVNGVKIENAGVVPENQGAEVDEKPKDPNALPDEACETLYIQNLNEKVQLPVLKQTLASLFKPYRPVLPVIAHRNVRMRGQAFVSFSDKESAARARKDVSEFPLYGKAMQVSFARSRQDEVVKRLDGDDKLEEHKKNRLEEKKRKRRDNPLRRKAAAKLRADETGVAPLKKARLQVPDEYLPPNNVLFIQNLPEGTTSDDLREVFEQHAGLVEIRTIPAKKDIAFVEYADEAAATLAKDALHNFKIDGETKMKVTYAKK